ncbi:hypothetical protein D3C81_1882620 [compost metagenome]
MVVAINIHRSEPAADDTSHEKAFEEGADLQLAGERWGAIRQEARILGVQRDHVLDLLAGNCLCQFMFGGLDLVFQRHGVLLARGGTVPRSEEAIGGCRDSPEGG